MKDLQSKDAGERAYPVYDALVAYQLEVTPQRAAGTSLSARRAARRVRTVLGLINEHTHCREPLRRAMTVYAESLDRVRGQGRKVYAGALWGQLNDWVWATRPRKVI